MTSNVNDKYLVHFLTHLHLDKLKFGLQEMEFYKKQQDGKIIHDAETLKKMKDLEKKSMAQEKTIGELRKVIGTFSKMRDSDKEKLKSAFKA